MTLLNSLHIYKSITNGGVGPLRWCWAMVLGGGAKNSARQKPALYYVRQ